MEPGEITVEDVSRRFRVHAREMQTLKDLFVQRGRSAPTDVWALHDVSLDVARGEAVGLIGRNGSGKTTLLRLVAGIIKPTTGTVRTEPQRCRIRNLRFQSILMGICGGF